MEREGRYSSVILSGRATGDVMARRANWPREVPTLIYPEVERTSFESNEEGETMSETSTLIGYQGRTISRQELALIQTPAATSTHVPVPHHEIVQALVETLGFRHIRVMADEYAVSPDGMKMFGVLDLETGMHGCRFATGLRNSHDKSMRLALTCGYRVFVCSNMAFSGDFQPVLAKALEELFACRRHLGRCGPDAAELRAHAAGRDLVPNGA